MSHSETERSFGPALRAARERRGLTQADVAAQLGVKRETISHWESGKHLPRPKQSARLDAALQTDGNLRALIDQAREAPTLSSTDDAAESVLEVFRRVQRAIESYLQLDANGRPLGWCHNLQQGLPPTPLSTAYGIRILHLIDETSISRLGDFAECLRRMQQPGGGWAIKSQSAPSPEATAGVIDALVRVDPGMDVSPYVDLMLSEIDKEARKRPAIVTWILETILDLRPDSPAVRDLIGEVLDLRRPSGRNRRVLWSQKAEPNLARPDPSPYHTARACAVLRRAGLVGAVPSDLTGRVDDALEIGVGWLTGLREVENTSEVFQRPGDGPPNSAFFRHFSASWVLRALLLCGVLPTHPTVSGTLGKVWSDFDDEHSLWRWSNGDLPIWMTFDGLATLRIAALAALPH